MPFLIFTPAIIINRVNLDKSFRPLLTKANHNYLFDKSCIYCIICSTNHVFVVFVDKLTCVTLFVDKSYICYIMRSKILGVKRKKSSVNAKDKAYGNQDPKCLTGDTKILEKTTAMRQAGGGERAKVIFLWKKKRSHIYMFVKSHIYRTLAIFRTFRYVSPKFLSLSPPPPLVP